jgi:DNA-binding MarR family transcriptional regulator
VRLEPPPRQILFPKLMDISMEYDLLEGRALTQIPLCNVELRPGDRTIARAPSSSFRDELSQILRFRRKRERVFGANLFSDPAWDILLELCLASETGAKVSISSLCLASSTPPTTALRCLHAMEKQGLIFREADPMDKRRNFARLTPEIELKLRELLVERFMLSEPMGPITLSLFRATRDNHSAK